MRIRTGDTHALEDVLNARKSFRCVTAVNGRHAAACLGRLGVGWFSPRSAPSKRLVSEQIPFRRRHELLDAAETGKRHVFPGCNFGSRTGELGSSLNLDCRPAQALQ